jgi:hypothetical protein
VNPLIHREFNSTGPAHVMAQADLLRERTEQLRYRVPVLVFREKL